MFRRRNNSERIEAAFADLITADPPRRHPVAPLSTAILAACEHPKSAYNQCHPVATLLAATLPKEWEPRLVQFTGWRPLVGADAATIAAAYAGDDDSDPESWMHYAVVVKPTGPHGALWVLDATARQFDRNLPWPHVYPLTEWRTWWLEARLQPTPRGPPEWKRLPRIRAAPRGLRAYPVIDKTQPTAYIDFTFRDPMLGYK